MTDAEPIAGDEQALFAAIVAMLADRGYLLPLAAAQRQFRDAYYGMSAAALLEDLFVDAFGNFLHQHRPGMSLQRPERGMKGWDYRVGDAVVSHKVGQGPTEIAALWDATRTDVTHWSFESSVLFTSSEYSPKQVDLHLGDAVIKLRPLRGQPDEPLKARQGVVAVRWGPDGNADVLAVWPATELTTVQSLVPFTQLWAALSPALEHGALANELEVLVAAPPGTAALMSVLSPGLVDTPVVASLSLPGLRPGVYLLARELLQNVPVKSNNRAVLLGRDTVAALMHQAARNGLFSALPTWFASWAPVRPPNLYLTQRGQYDQMFSGS